ncbi:MAG: hypothetical protein JWQ97_1704 [Phenylobacterium sp.]|nr:hypothetical protein [Phenylobacterium sp.]
MNDSETERARATAEDLIEALSAYQHELSALTSDLPGVAPLRRAVGAALAQACCWISDRDAGNRGLGRTTH